MIGQFRTIFTTILVFFLLAGCAPTIVDSNLQPQQAIYENQPPDVMSDIQKELVTVTVQYYGFDGVRHQGQVVIHKGLEQDIKKIFNVILEKRFPVESVIPIAHPTIQKKGPYGLSSDTNNTSAYVWRPIVKSHKLSLHALGLAIDINPRLNPYIKGNLVLPPNASYNPLKSGTLVSNSPVVQEFKRLGWEWGGDWKQGTMDYMHFQKIDKKTEAWIQTYRND
ncbi:M15 family metallopeptidase [Halodesulfovibrio aestuarii]|uniref:M15 family metallopeptidase n=1 Tax=Halodesulfovibrio aestuarii TaxID=126333 RepID=A0ABV4JYD6_9BACT